MKIGMRGIPGQVLFDFGGWISYPWGNGGCAY